MTTVIVPHKCHTNLLINTIISNYTVSNPQPACLYSPSKKYITFRHNGMMIISYFNIYYTMVTLWYSLKHHVSTKVLYMKVINLYACNDTYIRVPWYECHYHFMAVII